MSTVESRSIYNGPIRRSFAAADNRTRELAQVVSDLADEVAELQETLATNAQRLVAIAPAVTYDITIGAGQFQPVTNQIAVATVAGHYYRISMRIRATLSDPAGLGVKVLLYRDGGAYGDAYIFIGGYYVGFTHEWLVFGDGGTHYYSGMMGGATGTVQVFGNDGHFYCEHMGLVIP